MTINVLFVILKVDSSYINNKIKCDLIKSTIKKLNDRNSKCLITDNDIIVGSFEYTLFNIYHDTIFYT